MLSKDLKKVFDAVDQQMLKSSSYKSESIIMELRVFHSGVCKVIQYRHEVKLLSLAAFCEKRCSISSAARECHHFRACTHTIN